MPYFFFNYRYFFAEQLWPFNNGKVEVSTVDVFSPLNGTEHGSAPSLTTRDTELVSNLVVRIELWDLNPRPLNVAVRQSTNSTMGLAVRRNSYLLTACTTPPSMVLGSRQSSASTKAPYSTGLEL